MFRLALGLYGGIALGASMTGAGTAAAQSSAYEFGGSVNAFFLPPAARPSPAAPVGSARAAPAAAVRSSLRAVSALSAPAALIAAPSAPAALVAASSVSSARPRQATIDMAHAPAPTVIGPTVIGPTASAAKADFAAPAASSGLLARAEGRSVPYAGAGPGTAPGSGPGLSSGSDPAAVAFVPEPESLGAVTLGLGLLARRRSRRGPIRP